MDPKKHKAKWEGKHKLRIKHRMMDSGNPVVGYAATPNPRTVVGPIVAEFKNIRLLEQL